MSPQDQLIGKIILVVALLALIVFIAIGLAHGA